MKQRALAGLAAILCAVPAVRADVTIRYQTDFKVMPAIQALMDKVMKSQGAAAGVSVCMKGNKAFTTSGNFNEIFDFVKQEVTVIDPAHKTFAVLPVAQLTDALTAAMPQPTAAQGDAVAKFMSSVKTTSESRMTGQTGVIQGVQAEEREVTIGIDFPAGGKGESGPTMKLVMHIWTAKPSEALNVPAIRELTGYNAWQKYILNPAGMFEKLTGKMPGMGGMLTPLVEEISKNQTVILRMHMELFTPLAAMLAQKTAKPGEAAAPVDPNAPFMEVTQEVAELSSAPVDGALFDIPKDYSSVAVADLLGNMMPPAKP